MFCQNGLKILDLIERELKDKTISEDDNKKFEKNIQTLTDQFISLIDKTTQDKEKEISQL